jgi:N utilization substance protein B
MEPAPATSRQRRRARILALQTLYESDLTGHRAAEVLERLSSQLHASEEAYNYARDLISGVIRGRQEIDQRIGQFAHQWPVDQMAAVDRNLLRIGVFEALSNWTTIPVAVAIDEAVELAKLYGSEGSSRLIHGVLGSVVAQEAPGSLETARPGDD